MKNTTTAIIVFYFLLSFQLYGQKNRLQIGFGMNQNIHTGATYEIDSILIESGSTKDDLRPMVYASFHTTINHILELDFGIGCSNIYHDYVVGLYNQSFNSYTRKVGFKRVTTLTFPINMNFNLPKRFYIKAGFSGSLGFSNNSDSSYFHDTPEINDIYNSMQNIYKPHWFGYGFGCGYKIGRFDINFYRTNSISKLTEPISINEKEYDMHGKFHINSLSISYSILFAKKSEKKSDL